MVTLLAGAAIAAPLSAQSTHAIGGYTTRNGTYVAPHYQTNPDSSRPNNWSIKGNVNPYTGKPGTIDPYESAKARGTAYGSLRDQADRPGEDDPQ